MRHALRITALLFIVFFVSACAEEEQFSTSTEEAIANPDKVPSEIVKLILALDEDDRTQFMECLSEAQVNENDAKNYFTAKKIKLKRDNTLTYFVRPALDPYCHTFYGAHLFRYWFVELKDGKYHLLHKSRGDAVSILSTSTNGYQDILEESHTAVDNYRITMKFNNQTGYTPAECVVDHYSDGEIANSEKC